MLMWRIYYGDRTTYDNQAGAVEDAPGRDVQAIVTVDELVGRLIWHSQDYYWYDPKSETWAAGDIFGLWDYLICPGWKKVIFGRLLPRPDFEHILAMATNDPEFPPKSGFRQIERRRD